MAGHGSPECSIIIPVYNEGLIIASTLARVCQKMRTLGVAYEIIVVDDGSKDDTLMKVKACGGPITALSYPANRGKGYAVGQGMRQARGMYRLFMDADLSTSLDEVDKFLKTIRHYKFDMLIGNRRADPSLLLVKQPWARRLLARVFVALSAWTVGSPLGDFTCGFKMFTATAADIIFKRQRVFNWAFDTELILIALRHGCVVHEIPVRWANRKESKVRLWKDIPQSLWGLVQVRFNDMQGLYRP